MSSETLYVTLFGVCLLHAAGGGLRFFTAHQYSTSQLSTAIGTQGFGLYIAGIAIAMTAQCLHQATGPDVPIDLYLTFFSLVTASGYALTLGAWRAQRKQHHVLTSVAHRPVHLL